MAKKVLIVEDDPSIIQLYKLKFTEAKYEVLEADNGAVGLELAKQEKPSIILLDIIIPQYDGFAVLEMLKQDPTTKNIPVVLLTNLAQQGDKERGIKLGAVGYLVKANFTPSEVLKKVEAYIK